jgi:hypothetical protein
VAGDEQPDRSPFFAPDGGQRIDGNGRVTYDFTGHVHALGLDLDAGADIDASAADRKVRWTDTGNGAVVAEVYGFRGTVGGDQAAGTVVRAIPEPGTDAYARLEARSADNEQRMMVEAINFSDEYHQARLRFFDGSVMMLGDSNGDSGFVQVAGGGDRVISARGLLAVPPSFGGTRYASTAIPHGLGDVPGWADVSDTYAPFTDTSTGDDEPVTSAITDVDATYIYVYFILPPGVTCGVGPGSVWWQAST